MSCTRSVVYGFKSFSFVLFISLISIGYPLKSFSELEKKLILPEDREIERPFHYNFGNAVYCARLLEVLPTRPSADIAQERLLELIETSEYELPEALAESSLTGVYVYFGFIDPAGPKELADLARKKLVTLLGDQGERALTDLDRHLTELFKDKRVFKRAQRGSKALAKDLPWKKSRLASMFRQTVALPRTLRKLWKMVQELYSDDTLDENLWAFWGFHHDSLPPDGDRHYRMRSWMKIPLKEIHPWMLTDDVSPDFINRAMLVAMEIEDPIAEYTVQSGEGFRFLLPTLGRFMGKNDEQARYARENGIPHCESAWCAEEGRHGPAYGHFVEKLSGFKPGHGNPNSILEVHSNEEEALRHLWSRSTTEWDASSVYVVFAAHAREGVLKDAILNTASDEIKHLTVVSGADRYLHGHRPWKRIWEMLKITKYFIESHREERSTGGVFTENWAFMLEVAWVHILVEFRVRHYLKHLPFSVLYKIYETPTDLLDLAAFKPDPVQQAEIDRTLAEGKEKRENLTRWTQKQREHTMKLRELDEKYRAEIQGIIDTQLGGYKGAEVIGCAREKEVLAQIKALWPRQYIPGISYYDEEALVRELLRGYLRHYQIENNRHERAKKQGSVAGVAEMDQ